MQFDHQTGHNDLQLFSLIGQTPSIGIVGVKHGKQHEQGNAHRTDAQTVMLCDKRVTKLMRDFHRDHCQPEVNQAL